MPRATRKSRPLSLARVLAAALPLALICGALFLLIQYVWLPASGYGARRLAYEEFETLVRDQKVTHATVDGNIVRAETGEGWQLMALTPSVDRSVDLMIKKGVRVEAVRALPSSGLSLPVLVLALLPYPVLAYLAWGLVQAVGSGAEFEETEHLLKQGLRAPEEPAATLPQALQDSIETEEESGRRPRR